MANSGLIMKTSVKQITSPGMNNKLLKQIEDLFQQLFLYTENPDNSNPLSTIFGKLNDICQNLINDQSPNTSYVFDILTIMLKDYIKLLNTDQFLNSLNENDRIEHTNFLRQYSRLLSYYNIQDTIKHLSMKIRREIFFSLLDQLNFSTRILSYLENNFIIINSYDFIFYTILNLLINLKIKLTRNDLEKYQKTILNTFILYVNKYFLQKESRRINNQQNDLLIQQILAFICEISDKTLTIPLLINIDCPYICLQWLSLSYLDDYEYQYIVYILNNIARHDESIQILKQLDCIDIINQFKNEILNIRPIFIINDEWRFKISLILDLILAVVIEPDELPTDIINQVLLLNELTSTSIHFKYKGFHISSEPLIVLMKLCTNDRIMDYIFQQKQHPIYLSVSLKALLNHLENKTIDNDDNDFDLNILAIMALANILWSVSFHDKYKNELMQNISLIKKLEEFRESDTINYVLPHIYIPNQMSSLRRVLDGIWYNLYPSSPSKIEPRKSTSKTKTICSLMISYSHINISFCRQLYDILSKLPELSINVDFNNGKYLWKDIIQTIEQSDVILFLLSKDFYYSKSCRQEYIYVTNTVKKLFFPIFIDSKFKATDWLHKPIARLKSIRFGDKTFLDSCEELICLINENLSMNISLEKNPFDVTKWNDHDIKQWFINNNIISELYEFYNFQNGNELLLYANAILAFSWTKEYERIKIRFEEKFQEQTLSQDQFVQFINALKRL